jgi:deoxyribonuclease-4
LKNDLENVIEDFDKKIGLKKLKVIHLNDSKFSLGSKKDRHENIGLGTLGFNALVDVVYNPRLLNAIKILETPRLKGVFEEEIRKILNYK